MPTQSLLFMDMCMTVTLQASILDVARHWPERLAACGYVHWAKQSIVAIRSLQHEPSCMTNGCTWQKIHSYIPLRAWEILSARPGKLETACTATPSVNSGEFEMTDLCKKG